MAKVLFSITDAQLLCLDRVRSGDELGAVHQTTLTGLQRRKLIALDDAVGRYVLTPQGSAVIALCETLAIPSGRSKRGALPPWSRL